MIENAILILQNLFSISYSDACRKLEESAKIKGLTEAINEIENMERKKILSKHQQQISYWEPKNCFFTYVYEDGKRKRIYGKTEDAVRDKIVDFYRTQQNKTRYTLRSLLPAYLEYKQRYVSSKTIALYKWDWNTFLKDTEISDMPVVNLTSHILRHFLVEVTAFGRYDAKRISGLKCLLNGLLAFAVEEIQCISHNPMQDVSSTGLTFKQKKDKSEEVYTQTDIDALRTYLEGRTDIYELAIQLHLCLPLRIGELKALRWSDIDFNRGVIHVHTQILENKNEPSLSKSDIICQKSNQKRFYTHVNYTKSRSKAGKRTLPLTERTVQILEKIKELYPNDEYLFMKDGMFLITTTYNEWLERSCKGANIPYYSSHKIRFTNACKLYSKSGNLGLVQYSLGHSSSATTLHYLSRNLNKDCMTEAFSCL